MRLDIAGTDCLVGSDREAGHDLQRSSRHSSRLSRSGGSGPKLAHQDPRPTPNSWLYFRTLPAVLTQLRTPAVLERLGGPELP